MNMQNATPPPKPSARAALILALILYVVVKSIVPFGGLLFYPLTLLATWVHEMGHGVTSLVVGGQFTSLAIFANASGLAYTATSHPWQAGLVSAGGLVAPPIVGSALLTLSRGPRRASILMASLALAIALSLVLYVRSVAGWSALPLVVAFLVTAARWGSARVRMIAAQLVGVALAADTWSRKDYLFSSTAMVDGAPHPSDIVSVAHAFGGPYPAWGAAIALFSFVLLGLGLRSAWRTKPRRKKARGAPALATVLVVLVVPVVPIAVCTVGCSSSSSAGAGASPGDDGGPTGDAGTPLTASGCITDVSAGDHVFTCEGLTVAVTVPPTCTTGGCGLVLDIHGALETGDIEEAHMALRPIGRDKGYLIVQPSAQFVPAYGGPYWAEADDAHVLAILKTVTGVFSVDPARTHMTGFSQGGYMVWRFLCAHADLFASVAPGAAGLPVCGTEPFFDSCPFDATLTPSRQIDVLFLEGRKDNIVPFTCTSAERDLAIAGWGLGPGAMVDGDAMYTRTRYTNAQGTILETLEHDYTTDPQGVLAANGGHCYPGSLAHLGTAFDQLACASPNAFAWGQAVMDFFVAHPKK